jgi:hypothetical protein
MPVETNSEKISRERVRKSVLPHPCKLRLHGYFRKPMNALMGAFSLFAFILAGIVIFFIESQNARAVLFVALSTIGVTGLVLSVALATSVKRSNLLVSPFRAFGIKQYWAWQTPDYHLLDAALAAVIAVTFSALLRTP